VSTWHPAIGLSVPLYACAHGFGGRATRGDAGVAPHSSGDGNRRSGRDAVMDSRASGCSAA